MSEDLNETTKKYFDFLISDFGMKYQDYTDWGWTIYISEKLIIECTVDRNIPSLVFKRPVEPDNIKIDFGSILEVFGKTTQEKYRETLPNEELETNVKYIEALFRDIAKALLDEPETWWINAQKLKFGREEDLYLRKGQDPTWKESHRRWYRYIKSHDPSWESKIPVPGEGNS